MHSDLRQIDLDSAQKGSKYELTGKTSGVVFAARRPRLNVQDFGNHEPQSRYKGNQCPLRISSSEMSFL